MTADRHRMSETGRESFVLEQGVRQEEMGHLVKESTKPRPVWLSWLECGPVHLKVVGLIPSQGTYLGFRFNPQCGRQLIDVSLSH